MHIFEILKDTISAELMRARHEKKLRLQAVAEKCGLTVSMLDDIELGLRIPFYKKYEKLLRLYEKRTTIQLVEIKDDMRLQ